MKRIQYLLDNHYKKTVAVIVLAGVLGIFYVLGSINAEYERDCIAKGGVPFMPRDAKICLDPKAVIK